MLTAEELFVREYKEMIKSRKAMYGTDSRYAVKNLPIDNSSLNLLPAEQGANKVLVQEITEPFFDKLNNAEVMLYKQECKKRCYDAQGKPYTDERGNIVWQHVVVPQECVVIVSTVNIHLRNNYTNADGKTVKYAEKREYQYVDYHVLKNGVKLYMYIVPKAKVYRLNYNCLMLSSTQRQKFYRGFKLHLQNGNILYMYVLPFSPRYLNDEQTNIRVLGLEKLDSDMTKTMQIILENWKKTGTIFDWNLTAVRDGIKGVINCSFQELPSTLDEALYTRIGKCMEIETDDDNNDIEEMGEYI